MAALTLLLGALLAASATPTPAEAQEETMVRWADPAEVAALLSAKRLPATIKRDALTSIASTADGHAFVIFFLNCAHPLACRTLQFTAGFDDATISLEQMNAWNRDRRFGRAFLDEGGDPRVELDVNLDAGGMTRANLGDTLEVWRAVVRDFAVHIGWDRAPVPEKPDCEATKVESLAACAAREEQWKAGR